MTAPHYRTTRPHLTPLLYKAYLLAWRSSATLLLALAASLRQLRALMSEAVAAAWPLLQGLPAALLAALQDGAAVAAASQLLTGRGCFSLFKGGSGRSSARARLVALASHPIRRMCQPRKEGQEQAPSTPTSGSSTAAASQETQLAPCVRSPRDGPGPVVREGRKGLRRWLGKAVSLAVRAVGVPLVHRVLSRGGVLSEDTTEEEEVDRQVPVLRLGPAVPEPTPGAAAVVAPWSRGEARSSKGHGGHHHHGKARREHPRPRYIL